MEQGDLAEGFARALVAAEDAVFEDLDLALLDQEEAVAGLALDDHVLAGRHLDRRQVVAEALHGRDRQGGEDRVPAQQAIGALGDRGADLIGAQPGPAEDDEDRHQRAEHDQGAARARAASTKTIAPSEPSAIAAWRADSSEPITRPSVSSEPSRCIRVLAADLDEDEADPDPEPADVGGGRSGTDRRQHRRGAEQEAAPGDRDDEPAAVQQQRQAVAADQCADPPAPR